MSRLIHILIIVFCASCAAPHFAFNPETNLSMQMFSQLDKIAGRQIESVDSVMVYKALLRETLIERNAVGERKIQNDNSDLPSFPVAILDKYYEIYLFKIYSKPNDNYCIMLSTGFDQQGCIALGPGFFGSIRINQFNARKKLKMQQSDNAFELIIDKKEPKVDIYFIADADLRKADDQIRITQVIQKGSNKIAGSKPIVYDIEQVFRDPKALLFTYEATLRN